MTTYLIRYVGPADNITIFINTSIRNDQRYIMIYRKGLIGLVALSIVFQILTLPSILQAADSNNSTTTGLASLSGKNATPESILANDTNALNNKGIALDNLGKHVHDTLFCYN